MGVNEEPVVAQKSTDDTLPMLMCWDGSPCSDSWRTVILVLPRVVEKAL